MLSLSVPRLASLAPRSTFTSHYSQFLQRKPLSVSIAGNPSTPCHLIASFKPWRESKSFQLAAGTDSAEGDDEFEELEAGLAEEESESGPVEVEAEDEQEEETGDSFEFLEEGGELDDEEYDEQEFDEDEYDEEDERAIRAQMVLKFIWMEKNIGLALEKVVPGGKGSIPLTPYYFWPRKDAWEELKAVLEEKRWVSQKRMIILLNQATDIINLWQQSGAPTPTV